MPRVLSKFLSELQKEISDGSRNKTEGQSFLSDRAAEGILPRLLHFPFSLFSDPPFRSCSANSPQNSPAADFQGKIGKQKSGIPAFFSLLSDMSVPYGKAERYHNSTTSSQGQYPRLREHKNNHTFPHCHSQAESRPLQECLPLDMYHRGAPAECRSV